MVEWEILTRTVPYKGVADQAIAAEALKAQLKLENPDSCPDLFKSILKSTSVFSFTRTLILSYAKNLVLWDRASSFAS